MTLGPDLDEWANILNNTINQNSHKAKVLSIKSITYRYILS